MKYRYHSLFSWKGIGGKLIGLYFLLLTFGVAPLHAQDMLDYFQSMPAEMTPYLTIAQKTELVEKSRQHEAAQLVNALGDTTRIETATDDFLSIKMSPLHQIQLRRLPLDNGQSIIGMVRTYFAPAADSSLDYFDTTWNRVETKGHLVGLEVEKLHRQPEDMSKTDYEALLALLDPTMLQFCFEPETTDLIVKQSMPLLSNEERTQITPIIQAIRLPWRPMR